ncbi:MAG: hypothetical protein ACE37D_12215, partial [Pseudomonadales bacterium]
MSATGGGLSCGIVAQYQFKRCLCENGAYEDGETKVGVVQKLNLIAESYNEFGNVCPGFESLPATIESCIEPGATANESITTPALQSSSAVEPKSVDAETGVFTFEPFPGSKILNNVFTDDQGQKFDMNDWPEYGQCKGKRQSVEAVLNLRGPAKGNVDGYFCDGVFIPSKKHCNNPAAINVLKNPNNPSLSTPTRVEIADRQINRRYCATYNPDYRQARARFRESNGSVADNYRINNRQRQLGLQTGYNQVENEILMMGTDPSVYRQGTHAVGLKRRAEQRAENIANSLERLATLSDSRDPTELINEFNQRLAQIERMESGFTNQMNQEMAQMGANLARDLQTNNHAGVVYGGLSALGQAFENSEAQKEFEQQKQRLQQQRNSKMAQLANQIISANNDQRLYWYGRAAYEKDRDLESYYIRLGNYYNCHNTHINNTYSAGHSNWAKNPCRVPSESATLDNLLQSESDKTMATAQRKYKHYKDSKELVFLDAAIRFAAAAVESAPDNLSYYQTLGDYAGRRDPLTRYVAYRYVESAGPGRIDARLLNEATEELEVTLRKAIETGDKETIDRFYNEQADQYITLSGQSALGYAVQIDQPDSVQIIINYLIASGEATPESIKPVTTRLLMKAVADNSERVMDRLIKIGADVDFPVKDVSAVDYAAAQDHEFLPKLVAASARRSEYEQAFSNGASARSSFIIAGVKDLVARGDRTAAATKLDALTPEVRRSVFSRLYRNGDYGVLTLGQTLASDLQADSTFKQGFYQMILDTGYFKANSVYKYLLVNDVFSVTELAKATGDEDAFVQAYMANYMQDLKVAYQQEGQGEDFRKASLTLYNKKSFLKKYPQFAQCQKDWSSWLGQLEAAVSEDAAEIELMRVVYFTYCDAPLLVDQTRNTSSVSDLVTQLKSSTVSLEAFLANQKEANPAFLDGWLVANAANTVLNQLDRKATKDRVVLAKSFTAAEKICRLGVAVGVDTTAACSLVDVTTIITSDSALVT